MNLPIKKRFREAESNTLTTITTCLMLLSRNTPFEPIHHRLFQCKTCNRQFPSFQALGGHRASHKKPKLSEDLSFRPSEIQTSPEKPKMHECSICGVEFARGQALGGHMRKHRAASNKNFKPLVSYVSDSSLVEPIVKRSNSSRRIWCLDLNLTPFENDLEFGLGKMAPSCWLEIFRRNLFSYWTDEIPDWLNSDMDMIHGDRISPPPNHHSHPLRLTRVSKRVVRLDEIQLHLGSPSTPCCHVSGGVEEGDGSAGEEISSLIHDVLLFPTNFKMVKE